MSFVELAKNNQTAHPEGYLREEVPVAAEYAAAAAGAEGEREDAVAAAELAAAGPVDEE